MFLLIIWWELDYEGPQNLLGQQHVFEVPCVLYIVYHEMLRFVTLQHFKELINQTSNFEKVEKSKKHLKSSYHLIFFKVAEK